MELLRFGRVRKPECRKYQIEAIWAEPCLVGEGSGGTLFGLRGFERGPVWSVKGRPGPISNRGLFERNPNQSVGN